MNGRERFLKACQCQAVDVPPIWLMRQAGRALPEYRALKERHSFLELVRTPPLAAEVTLQPVRRFGFDAAILFSDILVVPEALGQAYQFRESGGIAMAFPVRTAAEAAGLAWAGMAGRLEYVADTLARLKTSLAGQTALLGFAGSPWTLANFMVEGGSASEFTRARAWWDSDRAGFDAFLGRLAEAVTEYLRLQIQAGADAVQIFDSLSGLVPPGEVYEAVSGRWIRQVIAGLGRSVPVIVFGRGPHWPAWTSSGATAISVDWTVALADVRRVWPEPGVIQGNLDPAVMTQTPAAVEAGARAVLEAMRGRNGFIFNLGHGLPATTKIENIARLVEIVRQGVWDN